jgi:hypothetical protein
MAVLLVLICASMARFLIFRLIPGVDIPNHLAVATIYKYASVPTHQFNHYFTLNSFLQPSTFHPWFCSLPIFSSVEAANRVFLCLYVVALPVSVLWLLRFVGGNEWLTLTCFPLMNNFNLSWGFVGFTIALPLIIFTYLATLRYLDSSTARRAVIVGGLLTLMFFVHVQATLFAALLFLVTAAIRHRRSLTRLGTDLLILLPAAALTVQWWLRQPGDPTQSSFAYLRSYYAGPFLEHFTRRFVEILALDNYFLFTGNTGVIVAVGLAASVVIVAVWQIIRARRELLGRLAAAAGATVITLAVVSLLCFFLLPHRLPGQDYIYQRFSVVALIAIAVLGGYVAGKTVGWPAKSVMVVVAVAGIALWTDYFASFNRENAAFGPESFPQEAPAAAASAMVFDYAFRGQPLYLQFPNYHIVWNEGIITTAIVDYRFGVVRRKPGGDPLPEFNQLVGVLPRSFNPDDIATEYVVVRGQPNGVIRSYLNDLDAVRSEGDWQIFREPTTSITDVAHSRPDDATH